MDDFSTSTLYESRNEWASRLVTILTPLIVDGYKSILEEAVKLCRENGEQDKYLMTFQNFISRVPKWNPEIIEREKKRICDKSGCSYLEDLVTCVHVIQLKILTAVRVGQKQKKIDISIPKLDDFIHKVYIHAARKIYKNVYLFELGIPPLQIQKNHRELEIIIQECILNTLRESIPVETILKAYMDETVEEDVVEEIKEQVLEEPSVVGASSVAGPSNTTESPTTESSSSGVGGGSGVGLESQSEASKSLSFDNIDYVKDDIGNEIRVDAPKTLERLEEISQQHAIQRKLESEMEAEEDNHRSPLDRLHISDEPVSIDALDFQNIDESEISLLPDLMMDDVDVLP